MSMDRRKFLRESVQGAAVIGLIPTAGLIPKNTAVSTAQTKAAPAATTPPTPVAKTTVKPANVGGWASLQPFHADEFDFEQSVLILSGSGDASVLVSQLFIAAGHVGLNKYFHLRAKKGSRRGDRLRWDFRDSGTGIQPINETPKFADSATELARRLELLAKYSSSRYVIRASPRDVTPATLEKLRALGWVIVYSRLSDANEELLNLARLNKAEVWSAPFGAEPVTLQGPLSEADRARVARVFEEEQKSILRLMGAFPGPKIELTLAEATLSPAETLARLAGARPFAVGGAHTLPRFIES